GRRARPRRSGPAEFPEPFLAAAFDTPHRPRVGADRLQLCARPTPVPSASENRLGLVARKRMRSSECTTLLRRALENPERIPTAGRASTPNVSVAVPPARARITDDILQDVL